MNDAVIVDAVRTPLGRRDGLLKDHHPGDLAALVLTALIERNCLDPALVDDVITGCPTQAREQSINPACFATLGPASPTRFRTPRWTARADRPGRPRTSPRRA